MDEQIFLTKAGQYLENLAGDLEDSDQEYLLDVECQDGVLEISDDKNRVYVINRHAASGKIWYSSPFSGADYFWFNDELNKWLNDKNEALENILAQELEKNYQISLNVN